MLNKRIRNANRIKFKSHTDVNNYNNFLLELDKKQRSSVSSNKDNINKTLKNIDNTFIQNNMTDPNFIGFTVTFSKISSLFSFGLFKIKRLFVEKKPFNMCWDISREEDLNSIFFS